MKRILPVILLCAGLGRAETAPDSVYQLNEIVVVADRVPTRLALVSASTERTDQPQASGDLNAWLGTLAGIQARSYGQPGGQSSVSIWGASSQQGLVLLEGHPVANPISGTPDLGLVPLQHLTAVEVARGAGSSLYGSSALGGVVNLIPESPTDHQPGSSYGRAELEAGTFQNAGGGFCFGRRSDNYGGQALAAFEGSDGPRNNDLTSSWNGGLGMGWYPVPEARLVLNGAIVDREMGLPGPRPDPQAIPNYGDSTASSLYDQEYDRLYRLDANGSWSPTAGLTLKFEPDWRQLLTRYWTLSPSAPSDDSILIDTYQSNCFGGTLLANYETGLGRLVAGYDNAFDFVNVESETDTNWNARTANHALWLELKAPIAGVVALGGSARMDYNPGFGLAFSPGLGIAVPIGDWLKFRGNWGTGFRAPSISDRYWPKSGVPNLKPEHGNTLQAGFDISTGRVNVEASTFLRRTSDLISWQPDTGGLWRPANIDSSRHLGAELSFGLKPLGGLEIRANTTWLNASQVRRELVYSDWATGENRFEFRARQAAFIPVLSANAEVGYRFTFGTRLSVTARYSGERLNYYPNWDSAPVIRMETKRLPAFAKLDAAVTQTLFEHWELALRLINVLDAKYSEQFGNSVRDLDYPMKGRTVAIQLRYAIE